jgi:hypothetical protein
VAAADRVETSERSSPVRVMVSRKVGGVAVADTSGDGASAFLDGVRV